MRRRGLPRHLAITHPTLFFLASHHLLHPATFTVTVLLPLASSQDEAVRTPRYLD